MTRAQHFRNKLESLKSLVVLGKLRFDLMGLSFILLINAAVFEGFSFGLLVPFLKQASGQGAYEGWKMIPIAGGLLERLHFESISHRIDWILIVIVLAVLIRQILFYVSQVIFSAVSGMFESRLRVSGYERILSYGCSFFDNNKKGEIHQSLISFTGEINALMQQFFGLSQSVFFALIYIILLVQVSPLLSVAALFLVPVSYGSLHYLYQNINRIYRGILHHEQQNYGNVYDVFSNIKLVKAMGRETDEVHKFKSQEQARYREHVLASSLYSVIAPLQEVLMALGIGIIVWGAYTYYLKDDGSFLIKLIVALLLFRRAANVLNTLFSGYPQMVRRYPYVQNYLTLINTQDKAVAMSGSKCLTVLRKGIEYRSVCMAYPGKELVLNNLSLTIPVGTLTAIVGASGVGKSTLAELLPRFYEFQSGEILIDDAPIREYNLKNLRRAIGFVSQDTVVLNDTIFNNILYAKPEASSDEIIEAATKARVTDFTSGFAEGLNTVIGDKGAKLSGGELQRLAIARVILRKPAILILDEATSALDSISETAIQESLNELAKGCTTIAIAHRLSTIQHADQIIVLENGCAVETGKMKDLLLRKKYFYKYWKAQSFESVMSE